MMVLVTVSVPPLLIKMPPPSLAVLLLTVVLVRLRLLLLWIPPPLPALFPLTVLLARVCVPPLKMPPPSPPAAVLSLIVLLVTVSIHFDAALSGSQLIRAYCYAMRLGWSMYWSIGTGPMLGTDKKQCP